MYKISELVKVIDKANSTELQADENFEIENIAASPDLASEKDLALVFPNKFTKAKKLFVSSKALTYLCSKKLLAEQSFLDYKESEKAQCNFIFVDRPKFALQNIIHLFAKARYEPKEIHNSAVIAADAKIADSVAIDAFCFIGSKTEIGSGSKVHPRVTINNNVKIGENTVIHSGVVIEDYCQIGSNVIIHPNAVIGADGYSYATSEASNLEKMQAGDFNLKMDRQIQHKVQQIGNVVIEDDVEIGANTCIDRATLGSTVVGQGSKIDNLCQIAHNVKIGKDCLVIAQVGMAGSSKIADRVTLAGKAGLGDGVSIGNDAVVGAYTAVNSDVDPFLPVLGAPAVPYGEFMKRQRALVRLPKSQEDLRKLKSKVDNLEKSFDR